MLLPTEYSSSVMVLELSLISMSQFSLQSIVLERSGGTKFVAPCFLISMKQYILIFYFKRYKIC